MRRRSVLLSNMTPQPNSSATSLWWRLTPAYIGLGLLCCAIPLTLFWYYNLPTDSSPPRQILIPEGASARRIGEILERENLVRSATVFAWTVRLKGLGHRLEAGTYRLDGSYDTASIVQDLLKAPVQTQRATLPEGLTRHEIASMLQQQSIVDSSLFIATTEDTRFIRNLGLEAETLEGYLFPETYFFDPKANEREIITIMVEQFKSVFADSLFIRLDSLGLSLHQSVTLASIVEREAVAAVERPVISGVFQRRLKLNRRLESCATVEYALGVHKRRLSNADLRVVSPFNTYRHRGLPPGPIGNPGKASILATLYPTDTEYLYFVARGDGTHIFSRTNKEHERAKRQIKQQERLARRSQAN